MHLIGEQHPSEYVSMCSYLGSRGREEKGSFSARIRNNLTVYFVLEASMLKTTCRVVL